MLSLFVKFDFTVLVNRDFRKKHKICETFLKLYKKCKGLFVKSDCANHNGKRMKLIINNFQPFNQ